MPLSIHILSDDAFDIISKCFVADIRVYRPNPKPETYRLFGFEGNFYDYYIKNIELSDLKGVRTIVPISFISNDRYYLGIHRDKLLSNPVILFERDNYMTKKIDKTWQAVVQNLVDESKRIYRDFDLSRMNVLNALSRKDKMSQEVIQIVSDKTRYYVSQVR